MHWIKGLINLLFCLFVCLFYCSVLLLKNLCACFIIIKVIWVRRTRFGISEQKYQNISQHAEAIEKSAWKEPRDGVQCWDSRDRAERLKCQIWVRTANHKEIRALAHGWEQKTERLYLERSTFPSPHTACYDKSCFIDGEKGLFKSKCFPQLCFSMCSAFARSSKPFWAQSSFLFWLKTGFFVLLAWKYGIMICLRQCWPLKLHLYSKCDLKHTSSSSELILLERWEDRFFLNVSRFALDQIYHVFGCL